MRAGVSNGLEGCVYYCVEGDRAGPNQSSPRALAACSGSSAADPSGENYSQCQVSNRLGGFF